MDKKPDIKFLGIGVVKSGTTWLSSCLREHPQVYMPYRKEICFFDWEGYKSNYDKGFGWYSKFYKKAKKSQVLGEFTNQYMYFENSHLLIKSNYPDVKLLVCLRNPVDMAYSLYWWKKSNYESTLMGKTFEKELIDNTEYVERGLYHKQLVRYFNHFPKENIKIILFDDIKDNPKTVYKEVCEFLEIDTNFVPSLLKERVNKTQKVRSKLFSTITGNFMKLIKTIGFERMARSLSSSRLLSNLYSVLNKQEFNYPAMNNQTRKNLIKIFKDDITKLESLLNLDLNTWKNPKE